MSAGDLTSFEHALARVMDGAATAEEIRGLLEESIPLMSDPAALVIGARALRARMIPVAAPEGAIDVCGTGGDGAHTLNISTAVAFVVAGAGVPVAKHGNRAMSSRSGAADVLEALGVTLTGDVNVLERALRDANIAFLFAQHHHPAMRHVAEARRALGKRTLFNLLGPLANPAGVKRQLVGVFAPECAAPMAHALKLLGAVAAWVVHGAGGMDELAAADGNIVVALDRGEIAEAALNFADPDGPPFSPEALRGGDARANASALRALLEGHGENGAYRTAVLLNAAAAIALSEDDIDLRQGWRRALESLESRAALAALNSLIAITSARARP